MLLLPQLPLQFMHRSGKNYSFFLSSEYERTQWIESVKVLQQTVTSNAGHAPNESINFNELQAWIETCRKVRVYSVFLNKTFHVRTLFRLKRNQLK